MEDLKSLVICIKRDTLPDIEDAFIHLPLVMDVHDPIEIRYLFATTGREKRTVFRDDVRCNCTETYVYKRNDEVWLPPNAESGVSIDKGFIRDYFFTRTSGDVLRSLNARDGGGIRHNLDCTISYSLYDIKSTFSNTGRKADKLYRADVLRNHLNLSTASVPSANFASGNRNIQVLS